MNSSHPARTFFLYLLAFVTLYMSAIALGGLFWQLINHGFPDPASPYDYSIDVIRQFLATLIVAFPVYAFMNFKLRKEQLVDEAFLKSSIRKWLTYATLVIASVIVISDVISLVYNFLGGEITLRFILKVLTVFVISGGVFWYYLNDIKKNS
ncbi:MAG: DUF5671 domain-containing protein [Candidatus Peregrinibacteria bacterium]